MISWARLALTGVSVAACSVAAVQPGAVLALAGQDPSPEAAQVAAPWSVASEPTAQPPGRPATGPAVRLEAKADPAPVPRPPHRDPTLDPDAVDSDLAAFVAEVEAEAARSTADPARAGTGGTTGGTTAAASGPTVFTLASSNVLGAVHTEPGKDADHYAPWRVRTEWTATYFRQREFDVVGLQEIEAHQFTALMRATGQQYDAWPGLALHGSNKRAVQTSLIWRRDRFEALQRSTLTVDFMYWKHPVPVVQLRDRRTQRTFWVINTHNAPRAWEAQRDRATEAQIRLIRRLRDGGEPVFFLGDLNEREETACRIFAGTDLVSPAGGSNDGRCILPRNRRIDWIFGPPEVGYAGYSLDRAPLVQQYSDHHVPQVQVTIR